MPETTLTLLYTANIFGRLDLAPHLATLIQRQQAEAEGLLFILDGGNTCSPAVWPCAVTGFRAGRTMLEAMACDASVIAEIEMRFFNSLGADGETSLAKMAAQGSGSAALNAAYSWIDGVQPGVVIRRKGYALGIVADWQPSQKILDVIEADSMVARFDNAAAGEAISSMQDEADLTVLLASEPQDDCFADICLWPDAAQAFELPPTLVVKRYSLDNEQVTLRDEEVITVSDDVPPEPTIAAVLELVVEEATRTCETLNKGSHRASRQVIQLECVRPTQ